MVGLIAHRFALLVVSSPMASMAKQPTPVVKLTFPIKLASGETLTTLADATVFLSERSSNPNDKAACDGVKAFLAIAQQLPEFRHRNVATAQLAILLRRMNLYQETTSARVGRVTRKQHLRKS
jgi:hypothetical protein